MIQEQNASFNEVASLIGLSRTKGLYAYSPDMFMPGKESDTPLHLKGIFPDKAKRSMLMNDVNTQLGINVPIQTLGQVNREIIEQRLYAPDISQFLPVKSGLSPFFENLTTFKQFNFAGSPEDGLISSNNTGQFNEVSAGYDAVTIKRYFWAKRVSWNFIQNMQAGLVGSGAIDILADRLKSLALNNKQLIQNIAMYGFQSFAGTGLLNNASVTVNTSLIPAAVKLMTATQIQTFVSSVMAAYFANTSLYESQMPDTFIMPLSDFSGTTGLLAIGSTTIALTQLDYLLNSFKTITNNPNFKIVATPYAQKNFSINNSWNPLTYDRYVLYQNKEDNLYLDMPIPFTLLGTGTVDNSNFTQLAYCQVGQVFNKRTQNMLYFDNLNS